LKFAHSIQASVMGNGMNKIATGLYVGNLEDASTSEQLQKNGITHILSVHNQPQDQLEGYTYFQVDPRDVPEQNIEQHFRSCNQFIHAARLKGGHVLVHCYGGISRSVTVTTAYLMVVTNQPWVTVLSAIKSRRDVANPNFGFKTQLEVFQQERLTTEREWLRNQFGILDAFGDGSIVDQHHPESVTRNICTSTNNRNNICKQGVSSFQYFSENGGEAAVQEAADSMARLSVRQAVYMNTEDDMQDITACIQRYQN